MKKLLLTGLLFYCTFSFATVPSLKTVRMLYHKAATEEKSCNMLLQLLSAGNVNGNPLLIGYKGSATMLMAKYTINPISKYSYFKKGKRMIENAIDSDATNVELRFLRFAVQTQIPSFLGYYRSVDSDKKFLLESFPLLKDDDLKNMIRSYFENCNCLTVGEKQKIR
ncbi:MAG: hypothetical protein ACTHOB_11905 [Ginsengibacter sp.]